MRNKLSSFLSYEGVREREKKMCFVLYFEVFVRLLTTPEIDVCNTLVELVFSAKLCKQVNDR